MNGLSKNGVGVQIMICRNFDVLHSSSFNFKGIVSPRPGDVSISKVYFLHIYEFRGSLKLPKTLKTHITIIPWIFGIFFFVRFHWHSKDRGENNDLFTECFQI